MKVGDSYYIEIYMSWLLRAYLVYNLMNLVYVIEYIDFVYKQNNTSLLYEASTHDKLYWAYIIQYE